jgi:hypothetical protein
MTMLTTKKNKPCIETQSGKEKTLEQTPVASTSVAHAVHTQMPVQCKYKKFWPQKKSVANHTVISTRTTASSNTPHAHVSLKQVVHIDKTLCYEQYELNATSKQIDLLGGVQPQPQLEAAHRTQE